MLVSKMSDNELKRLSADIKRLTSMEKEAMEAKSKADNVYFAIVSQLKLRQEQHSRLKGMLGPRMSDDELKKKLSADIIRLTSMRERAIQTICMAKNVHSNILSQLESEKEQHSRLKELSRE